MPLVVVGIHERSAPLDLLERVALGPEQLPKALDELMARSQVKAAVLLSTCMRTEVYAEVEEFHAAAADLRDFLGMVSGVGTEELGGYLYSYWGEGAIRHLLTVASGLDSAVLGEGEVLAQVRRAWEQAVEAGSAGQTLSALGRHAVETGKRVRTETGISRGYSSLATAAVGMAGGRLGSLIGRSVAVVGSGEMGAGLLAPLIRAGAAVTVVGRERAAELALESGLAYEPLSSLAKVLSNSELVFCALTVPIAVIDADQLSSRGDRPLLVIDAALPRNVDAGVSEIDGVTLLDLDDLRRFAERGWEERRREAQRARQLVDQEVERYSGRLAASGATPLVSALHTRAETVRTGELEHYRTRLGALDDRQSEALEALTKAIVAKLLHPPTSALRQAAAAGRGERLFEAATALFALDDVVSDEEPGPGEPPGV